MLRRLVASLRRKQRIFQRNNTRQLTQSEKYGIHLSESLKRSLVSRILGFYFGKFYQDSRHRLTSSFLLVSPTTVINNEALDYDTMRPLADDASADRRRERSRSPAEREVGSVSYSPNARSPDVESLDQSGKLDDLQRAYLDAQQNESNIWLDYANQSCFIYLHRGGGRPSESLAAFDLDGTLIRPKSNKRIPKSATDWDLFSVWTKVKLQQALRENQARFVIFTNQNGIGLNIVPLEEVQERVELVLKRLDMPCTVFVATEKDVFRKPRIGMFQLFNKSFNDSTVIDYEKSFYCGDAVGYPSHSDADIKFAQKLGLPFLPPEKFLRGVKPKLVN